MNIKPISAVVAFPSFAPGGLDALLSPHFGHCDVFTLVTFNQRGIERTDVIPGVPHEHGGCMAPVNLLAGNGVSALIASGMGRRPLMGFMQANIAVFFGAEAKTVQEAALALLDGRLQQFTLDHACGGSHEHE